MSDVVERLAARMNEHDLPGAVALIHPDYRSEQPLHPGRAFVGRAQMEANWRAIFDGIPDFHAELIRSVQDGETVWSEWHWTGRRRDGEPFEVRGVTLFDVQQDHIVAGRLYLEDVVRDNAGIEDAVLEISGRRPHVAGK
ncbi:MAG: nuclear transport factor 2 family protein [Dermatophilaceae bacterium]